MAKTIEVLKEMIRSALKGFYFLVVFLFSESESGRG